MLLGSNIRIWKMRLNISQKDSKMLLILCLLFCNCFRFFSITINLWLYEIMYWDMYSFILWLNILAMSHNCNGLFLMFPFPSICQSGFIVSEFQSCVLISKSTYESLHFLNWGTFLQSSFTQCPFPTSKFCVPLLFASAYIYCGNYFSFNYL